MKRIGFTALACLTVVLSLLVSCKKESDFYDETVIENESDNNIQYDVEIDETVAPFEFTLENYPKMGGSLANLPLGEAVTATVLGIDRNAASELIVFEGSTTDNYEALVDGTFDDNGTGMFKELYSAILEGASWHKPDHYYLGLDFDDFMRAKIEINNCQKDKYLYAKKCFINMCNAGKFSSDRTIKQYADEIWQIEKV